MPDNDLSCRHFIVPTETNPIAELYQLEQKVNAKREKVLNACKLFTEKVITRSRHGAIFLSWKFNHRGTLIEITYTVPDDFNERSTREETEFVSFDEIASYIKEENVFNER
jgi:hypothetical protein